MGERERVTSGGIMRAFPNYRLRVEKTKESPGDYPETLQCNDIVAEEVEYIQEELWRQPAHEGTDVIVVGLGG
jgi:hypothetical protein